MVAYRHFFLYNSVAQHDFRGVPGTLGIFQALGIGNKILLLTETSWLVTLIREERIQAKKQSSHCWRLRYLILLKTASINCAHHWDQVPNILIKVLIWSIREADCSLEIQCLLETMSWFAAYDRINYTGYFPLYAREMIHTTTTTTDSRPSKAATMQGCMQQTHTACKLLNSHLAPLLRGKTSINFSW